MIKLCKECGKEILRKSKKAIYCSKKCSGKPTDRKKALKRKADNEYREKIAIRWRKWDRKRRNIPFDAPIRKKPGEATYYRVDGYLQIFRPNHPNCNKIGRIFEHQFIMSEYLGRPLKKGENIHHKNGIRHDNRIENLELWTKSQPAGQRVEDKIKWCEEFLEQYGYTIVPPPVAQIRIDAICETTCFTKN